MRAFETIQFKNCRLIRDHKVINDDLWICGDKIINPQTLFYVDKSRADHKIDCNNAIIAPGYIDIQINGGYGVDFSFEHEDIAEGVNKVARKLLECGVTSFCPTIITSPVCTYKTIIPQIPTTTDGANILGAHLEGPFINMKRKGAHPEEHIRTLDEGMDTVLSTYGSLTNVKIITLAPELDAGGVTISALNRMGITVSLGHSDGNLEDVERSMESGARLITHLFNAMMPFHHRVPGLVGALISDVVPAGGTIFYSIIADGIHTHVAALRLAYRTHPAGLILITDAIPGLGLGDGTHRFGQMQCTINKGRAYVAGTNTLCGSITPMCECVRIFKKATGCDIAYAIEVATLHPAQCLQIHETKGTLNFGADADFIMLDDDLNVQSTWIAGKKVYQS